MGRPPRRGDERRATRRPGGLRARHRHSFLYPHRCGGPPTVVGALRARGFEEPCGHGAHGFGQHRHQRARPRAPGAWASVPYRLFVECLLGRLVKGWTVEQLAAKLKTTKATIYRHINKLKEMDLLDEVNVTERSSVRKGYRIRYGNLSKAWNFVESNVEIAMENYRKTVDHLEKLAEQRR